MSPMYLVTVIYVIIGLLIGTSFRALRLSLAESVSYLFLADLPPSCAQNLAQSSADTSLTRVEDVGEEKRNESVRMG